MEHDVTCYKSRVGRDNSGVFPLILSIIPTIPIIHFYVQDSLKAITALLFPLAESYV
jgi:hypothetical protein